jgi:hypothetical protein
MFERLRFAYSFKWTAFNFFDELIDSSEDFFNLCFIGPVGFDDHLIDSSSSILFASASFGGGCSAGVYQQIVKNIDTYN